MEICKLCNGRGALNVNALRFLGDFYGNKVLLTYLDQCPVCHGGGMVWDYEKAYLHWFRETFGANTQIIFYTDHESGLLRVIPQ